MPTGHATVALPPAKLRISAGESTILRLRLSNVGVRRLRRAPADGADSWARVQLTATAAAGPPTVVDRRLAVSR